MVILVKNWHFYVFSAIFADKYIIFSKNDLALA